MKPQTIAPLQIQIGGAPDSVALEEDSFALAVADDRWLLDAGSDLLVRRRLIARLAAIQTAPLAILIAPAGYGKTVTLEQWAQSDPRPFHWLTPAAFAHNPLALSRGIFPDVPSVTVIDDAHELSPELFTRLLAQVQAEHRPGSVVAIASRCDPASGLGRLRAHRLLVEIRSGDLALGPSEGAVLFRKAGLRLREAEVGALITKTQGWPAALHLAGLSLGRQADTSAAVQSFSGDDHLIRDYVADEFLSALSAEDLEFLTETSVLRDLSAKSCDALLQRDGSGAQLTRLSRWNQLLQPLGPSHDQFQWHPLIRDALKAEFRQAQPHRKIVLQRRASAWHAARGNVDEAVDHAVAAGDAELTGELLLAHLVGYVYSGERDVLPGWLAGFSDQETASIGALAMVTAHAHLAAGEVDAAQRWAAIAGESDRFQRSGGAMSSDRTAVAVIHALLSETDMGALSAVGTETPDGDLSASQWAPLVAFLQGSAAHLTGDDLGAELHLDRGVRRGKIIAPAAAALCLGQLIVVDLERRDSEGALALCEQSLQLIAKHELAGCALMSFVFAACAAAYAVTGHADEGKLNLRRSKDLLARGGECAPWLGAETRLLMARASLSLADIVRARTLLSEASRLARRAPTATVHQRWFDEAWAQLDTLSETSLAGPSSLSIAELRVLRFLPSHRSFREIGEQLGVSANTIKTQAHSIYRKLDATSRSEAVSRASELGLLGC